MDTIAGISTFEGTAALAQVEVMGPGALKITESVFRTRDGERDKELRPGRFTFGGIYDGESLLDEVIVCCENEEHIRICTHGSGVIVEEILNLLHRRGAGRAPFEKLTEEHFARARNEIEKEARHKRLRSLTLEGVKILDWQKHDGLVNTAKNWIEGEGGLNKIHSQCQNILRAGQTATGIIEGVNLVIAGPPNAGKSTLFNHLTAKENALVSDIPGTTRDYLHGMIRTKRLLIRLYDTAGLDRAVRDQSGIDREAQQRSESLIHSADLIVWLMDTPNLAKRLTPAEIISQIHSRCICPLKPERILPVFNKIDCMDRQPAPLKGIPRISAETGEGIQSLINEIEDRLGVRVFKHDQPVCFTQRQRDILERILSSNRIEEVKSLSRELLSVRECV